MKVKEFMKVNNLKTMGELRHFLRENLKTGKTPVSMRMCPLCDCILEDDKLPIICPDCGYGGDKFANEPKATKNVRTPR